MSFSHALPVVRCSLRIAQVALAWGLCFGLPTCGLGQAVVWGEEFENGCTGGCLATAFSGQNGAWSQTSTGTNGTCPNAFFVSCKENGNPVGQCGSTCGTNESLHIGNSLSATCLSPNGCLFCPGGDCGAAYDAGCPPGICIACCSCTDPTTDKRMESPVINLAGYTTLTLRFKYMEGGQGTTDNSEVWYFDGALWALLADMPKTPVCGGGQGMWTSYGVALPASADNNPAVRIGFRWVNDNDGVGTDPSFAVDDVQITRPYTPGGVGLIVNELSNGPSGSKEYIELLAVGPACTTIDIRGIKVDDNNGITFNGFGLNLPGSGVSQGHLRFANIAQWAAVPVGSLILIYNDVDLNALVPAADVGDASPKDSIYIVPASNAVMQGCNNSPNATLTGGYFGCTTGVGNWLYCAYRNQGDAAQTRDALGHYFHGISYGPDVQNMNTGGLDLLRISLIDHSGRVILFNSGNYRLPGNFTSAVVAGNETPGAPNNAANNTYRKSLLCVQQPVELLSFSGEDMPEGVRLRWITATETDNDHFTLERSANATDFEPIGSVQGGGTSLSERHYVFDDHGALAGINYYRLLQVDLNGVEHRERVISVRHTALNTAWVRRSEEGLISIGDVDAPGSWMVSDALGRGVASGTLNAQGITTIRLPAAQGFLLVSVITRAGIRTWKLG